MSDLDPTVHVPHDPAAVRSGGTSNRLSTPGTPTAEIDLGNPDHCRFGAYTLVERIGAGGIGLVYRAHQPSLERDVAIKILNVHADDAEALARFRFEARSAAALNHPNIVQILEVGEIEGTAFIAMQLVRGESLAARIVRERMGFAEAVATMLKLCDAVGYAHRLNLLHLDLKPANVLIDERGEPLVADFGLARHMDERGQVQAQEVSGTPAYMAPEQVLVKELRLGVATDVYSLGAILYELLCGQPPHGRGAAKDVTERALRGDIPAPRSLRPAIPKDLEAIALQCLRLKADERYPSVAALADDLRRYAAGLPVSTRRPGAVERLQRWYAREPKFATALAAALALAIGGSFVLADMYRNAERERRGAEGLVQVMMSQRPSKSDAVLPRVAMFNVPLLDCTRNRVDCGAGASRIGGTDLSLSDAQRQQYLDSLRAYVPRISTWGDRRMSTQLAQTLDDVQDELYEPRRAQAAAATGTTNGLLFAYLLAHNNRQSSLDRKAVMGWFDAALAKVDQPWQAQALAQSCEITRPACLQAIERFRALDPDNAAAWTLAMPPEANDDGDRRLLRAAAAPRLVHHDAELVDAALAFGKELMPKVDASLRVSPGEFAHEVWEESGPIDYPTDYCRRSFVERDVQPLRDACHSLFAKVDEQMRPSLYDELVAASAMRKMEPATATAPSTRLRDARWLWSVRRQLPPGTEPDEALSIAAIRDHGELAYLRTLFASAHLPVAAPPRFASRESMPWSRRPATPDTDASAKPDR